MAGCHLHRQTAAGLTGLPLQGGIAAAMIFGSTDDDPSFAPTPVLDASAINPSGSS